MTGRRAVRTDWVRKLRPAEDYCENVYELRKPYSKHGFIAGGRVKGKWRIMLIAARPGDRTYRMRNGAGPGTTLRKLRSLYGDELSKPVPDKYEGDTRMWVRVRTRLGFVNFVFDPNGELTRHDRVTWMAVSRYKQWGFGGC